MRSWHEQRPPCAVPTCIYEVEVRDWCHAHYARVIKHGHPQADVPLQPHRHRSTKVHPDRAHLVDGRES